MKSLLCSVIVAASVAFSMNVAFGADCPAGTYNADTGTDPCTPCGPGTYSETPGSTSCDSCLPGTYSASIGATTCTDCAPHTFSDTLAAMSCTDCATGTYQPSSGQTSCLNRDGMRCWFAKDQKMPAFVRQDDIATSDPVGTGTVDLKAIGMYCAHADYAGNIPGNPDPHLCCYKTAGGKLASPKILAVSGPQFGSGQVQVSKPALVCEQCDGAGAEQALQCWKTKDKKAPKFTSQQDLQVTDGLSTDLVDVTKHGMYCASVSIDGSPVTDPDAQQCCYRIAGAALETPVVTTPTGAVGGTFQIEVRKQAMACEPCTSSVVP